MKVESKDVGELRHALLELHKSLLDAQRIRYERERGRIESSQAFLGVVLEHQSFAWLRTMSALIARLDEWLEERDAADPDELDGMITTLRSLVQQDGAHAFSRPYWDIVNAVPEVLIAHVKLWRLLDKR